MIVICEECGRKYRVDLTKIHGRRATFQCSACENVIMVKKPETNSSQALLKSYRPKIPESPRSSQVIAPDGAVSAATRVAEVAQPNTTRLSLVAKMVGIMLAVSLIPLASFGLIALKKSSDQMRIDTERYLSQVALGYTMQVDEWIDKNVRALKAISILEDISSMDPKRQEPILKALQSEYPWMYLVFTTDAKGMNIARSDGKALKDYSDRKYYQAIMAGKVLSWQVLIGKTSKKPALVLALPIQRDGKTVGVVANAMQLDDISKLVANWKRGETGYAFLVDEGGRVVAHKVHDFVIQQKELLDHPMVAAFFKNHPGTHYFKNDKGIPYIGNIRGTRYGWALGVQQAEAEAFAFLRTQRQQAVEQLIITAIGVILVAWLLGRAVVKPIKELTVAAERISVGDLDVEINIRSHDEIAALGNAISRMQDSIRYSMKRLRRRR